MKKSILSGSIVLRLGQSLCADYIYESENITYYDFNGTKGNKMLYLHSHRVLVSTGLWLQSTC